MLVQEKIYVGDRMLIKTYSDNNKYVINVQTGAKYEEAVDVPYKYTYVESEEDVQEEIEEEQLEEIE